jgi:cephalosporin-C deacetylase
MHWNQEIKQYNQQIPISLEQLEDHWFRFMSSLDTWVYGKLFIPCQKREIDEVIVLYHGLGAHLNTQGYIDIAKSWTDRGFYVIGMDCRHQGGKTYGLPKRHPDGLYLSGVEHEKTYYYAHVYLDAIRLIDVAQMLIPNARIYATGGSQGGTLAIFAGTFHSAVELVMADMPSCIDIPYLIRSTESGFKVFKSLIDPHQHDSVRILDILAKIDLLIISKNIKTPVLLSSGDQDLICPLKTTQMFYDLIHCEKRLVIYPGYGHGGFDELHLNEKIKWIDKHYLTKKT